MGVYWYHVLLYTPQLGSRLGQNPRIYRSWCGSSSLCNQKSQLSLLGLVWYRSYEGPHLLLMSQWACIGQPTRQSPGFFLIALIVYHVKVLYVVLHVTMGEGPIRSWHTKEAKCKERGVFNHKNPTPNVTYLQKRESETLYPDNCVRNIQIHIPKVKPLAKHLRTSPPPFQHSQNCFQDY